MKLLRSRSAACGLRQQRRAAWQRPNSNRWFPDVEKIGHWDEIFETGLFEVVSCHVNLALASTQRLTSVM
jgi:hypothetical protein